MFKTFLQSGDYELFIRHAITFEQAEQIAQNTARVVAEQTNNLLSEVTPHIRIVFVPQLPAQPEAAI